MLDGGQAIILIDCRTAAEHNIALIEGGLLVPLQDLGSRLWELEEYADDKVIVYCHHGIRSMQMVLVLRRHGLNDVYSMAGGIDLWSIDIDPSVPRY